MKSCTLFDALGWFSDYFMTMILEESTTSLQLLLVHLGSFLEHFIIFIFIFLSMLNCVTSCI